MPQNYKVTRGEFGQYRAGSVLPEYVVKQAGDVTEMVRRRLLEPTSDPVNVTLATPKVQTVPTVPAAALEERNQLSNEVVSLTADNRKLVAALAAADQRVADFKAEIAKYVEENGDLRRQLKRLEGEQKALADAYDRIGEELKATQADLEAATAPAPATPEAKADAKKK